MATGRQGGLGLVEGPGLNREESLVLRSLDGALGLYRGLPELTETELRTLWATDQVLRDMLCARAMGRDRRGELSREPR